MRIMLKYLMILLVIMGINSCNSEPEPIKKSTFEIEFEEKIKSLIEEEADLNQKDESGIPLLVWATTSELKYVDSVKLLLSHGADPNVKVDADGSTALHRVIGSLELVESKNLNKQIAEQQRRNEQNIMKSLLKKGATINVRNRWGETPLYIAAGYGREDLCQILIEEGANVNSLREVDNSSPLHHAATAGYWKLVKLLLKNGANVNGNNKSGNTALSLAYKKEKQSEYTRCRKLDSNFYKDADYNKTIDILQEYGAKE